MTPSPTIVVHMHCPEADDDYSGPTHRCAGDAEHYLREADLERGVIAGYPPKCPVWLDREIRCDEPLRELECDGRCPTLQELRYA